MWELTASRGTRAENHTEEGFIDTCAKSGDTLQRETARIKTNHVNSPFMTFLYRSIDLSVKEGSFHPDDAAAWSLYFLHCKLQVKTQAGSCGVGGEQQ